MYEVMSYDVELGAGGARAKKAALRNLEGRMSMRDMACELGLNVADTSQGSHESLDDAIAAANEYGVALSYDMHDGRLEMAWAEVDEELDEKGWWTTVYSTDPGIVVDGPIDEWRLYRP